MACSSCGKEGHNSRTCKKMLEFTSKGPNEKIQKMLKRYPDIRGVAIWSLSDTLDPKKVITNGPVKFAHERYYFDNKKKKFTYKLIEVSKPYKDPTYEDAWKEFRRMSVNYNNEIGDYDHIFLESVAPSDKTKIKGYKVLTFGTGS